MEKEEIIIGKEYILRGGLKTGPIRKSNNGTNYIFEAEVKEPQHEDLSIVSWKQNGRFLIDTKDHNLDIILKGWE